MASSSLPTTTAAHMSSHYKGKVTRSWPQLPPELIRHIATFYLSDASIHNYCPQTWDVRELWHPRMVYTALRDAQDIERLMAICPQWSIALEHHFFWQQAVALIDPLDVLAHHAIIQPHQQIPQQATQHSRSSHPRSPQQHHHSSAQHVPPPQVIRLSQHVHFRNIVNCSCIVCRINAPNTSLGLTNARRTLPTLFLGPIGLCREHDKRKLAFCGLCLRESREVAALGSLVAPPAGPLISAHGYNASAQHQTLMVGCLENEDEATFPGVFATCRSCRFEHLWERASLSVRSTLALGGTPRTHGKPIPPTQAELESLDWETRQVLDAFIEMAEGSVSEVLTIAAEKRWLRKYTRLTDMLGQALAAQRFNSGGGVDQRARGAVPIRRSGDYADARGQTGERGGLRREEDQSGEPGWVQQDTPDDATSLSGYSGSESDEDDNAAKEQRPRVVQGESPQSRPRDQREAQQQRHTQASSPHQQRNAQSMYPTNEIQFVEDDVDDIDIEEEDEEEDDDEDPELLQLTEESGVRELALGDWARTRILDGFWISPADLWAVRSSVSGYAEGRRRRQTLMKSLTKIRAVHPVPWAREEDDESRREEKYLEDKGCETQSDLEFDSDEDEAGGRSSRSPISRSRHPKRSTVHASIPPSHSLCEGAYQAHQAQMRAVLLAPMKNVVRKVVMESQEAAGWRVGCEDLRRRRRQAYQHGDLRLDDAADEEGFVDGQHVTDEDAVLKVSRMTVEDVLGILRDEEGVWFDGVNWAEKRRNERLREREQMISKRRKAVEQQDELIGGAASSTVSPRDGASTTSSGPGSGLDSESTSPVLSVVTLQTTPSPPPPPNVDGDTHSEEKQKLVSRAPPRTNASAPSSLPRVPIDVLPITTWMPPPPIALAPVLSPPRLLRPIPYIPTTLKGLPEFTIEAINSIWREACGPLYHCQCKICQRAVAKANADAAQAAAVDAANNYAQIQPQQVRSPSTVTSDVRQAQIHSADTGQVVQLTEIGEDEREHLVSQIREEEEEGEEEYEEEEESITSGEVRRAYEEEEEDDLDSVRYAEEYEEEVIEVIDEEGDENEGARSDFGDLPPRGGSPQSPSSPRKTVSLTGVALTSTAKKRSVSAMQNEELEASAGHDSVSRDGNANHRGRTPPKRARTQGSGSDTEDSAVSTSSSSPPASRALLARRSRRPNQPLTPSRSKMNVRRGASTTSRSNEPTPVPSSSPGQVRKRSSEELEDLGDTTPSSANSNMDDNGSDQSSVKGNKRIKVVSSPLPSPRLSPRRRTPRAVAAMQTGNGHRTHHNQPIPALKLETEGLYVIGDED
ncbi:hypothetical protein BDN72DRAFT_850469 [Pluteus cervinus]|uniref:Uncharacterized protein n=1 Tax=Pluteus cervinus TaxID=181527 RepID=A0ACD3A3V8_9AGAR|nr:hypothetical protein BDN72DRAFT_850469 [Pluteus cervinus]